MPRAAAERDVPSSSWRRAAHGGLHTGALALGLAVLAGGGCVAWDEPPELGSTTQLAVVDDFLTTGCSTGVLRGLSVQIADEVGCMLPDALVEFGEEAGIQISGPQVLPYLSQVAVDDLYAAATAAPDRPLVVNSAYRTVAQQYLLYEWYQRGRCGITAAAQPGDSNHESGRALDIDNWYDWVGTFGDHGWGHTVPGDDVHFDHLDSPDIRGADVLAFQRLWNRNHPEDPIDEDGDFGPMTAARLRMAPADGFAVAGCEVDEEEPPEPEPAPEGDGEPGSGGEGELGAGLEGGCAAGGGGASAGLALALLALLARAVRSRRTRRPAGTCT